MAHIAGLDGEGQGSWLILMPHSEFRGAWYVDSLDPSFLFDFEDIIGEYRTIFPSSLEAFKQRADELDYELAWTHDPGDILAEYEGLDELPPFSINSNLPDTIQGLFPWQIEGFNKLIKPDDLRGGLCFWDTGTGKTIFVAMGILWHLIQKQEADLALVVVKSNNKRDIQKKLKKLAGIDSVILDGTPDKRALKYLEVDGNPTRVIVTNYEKIREDQEFFEALLTGRRVLIFWDEMPTKLRNRGTQLYNAVRDTIYEPVAQSGPLSKMVTWDQKRPTWLRQYELTATPIERDPGDQFSCVRLIDPDVLGTVKGFEGEHVLTRNPFSKKPKKWGKVDKMGNKLAFMSHRVDKRDSKVSKHFPEIIEDHVSIDWDPIHRNAYDVMAAKAVFMLEEDEDVSVLALIQVLQMMCDAPSMVNESALRREIFGNMLVAAGADDKIVAQGSDLAMRFLSSEKPLGNNGHTKLLRLKEDLTERHPESKAIIFSTWADYIFPVFEEHLTEWGISYVTYAGTDKQKQDAKSHWRFTDNCRVLVSSDSGSDSIDLPEASFVVNYNLPYLYSRRTQRVNRASRADSPHQTLYVNDYVMAHSVEERRVELIEERKQYHDEFLDMSVKVAQSMSYTREDLLYMLLGDSNMILGDGGR